MAAHTKNALEAARIILDSDAVYTRTSGDPFFFSSGWASPVFVDIKRLISLPAARERLIALSLDTIAKEFEGAAFAQIAGCELAGVPFAAIMADRLGLPLVVAMKQGKGFGRLAHFEGSFAPGTATLLVDDLTTDGRTKATFKGALEAAEANVVGVFVILDYGVFPAAPQITSLVSLPDILHVAERDKVLEAGTIKELKAFAAAAPQWSRRNGGVGAIPT